MAIRSDSRLSHRLVEADHTARLLSDLQRPAATMKSALQLHQGRGYLGRRDGNGLGTGKPDAVRGVCVERADAGDEVIDRRPALSQPGEYVAETKIEIDTPENVHLRIHSQVRDTEHRIALRGKARCVLECFRGGNRHRRAAL